MYDPANNAEDARARAIRWSRLMRQQPAVWVDTETTGTGPDAQICQIGILVTEPTSSGGLAILAQFSKLVRPTVPIEPGASAVHGITDEIVARDGQPFELAWLNLERYFKGANVIAYNSAFDMRMLVQTAKATGVKLPPSKWHCAMLAYAAFRGIWNAQKGGWKWAKLTEAVSAEGLEIRAAHDALDDILMTEGLVQHMAEQGATYGVEIAPGMQVVNRTAITLGSVWEGTGIDRHPRMEFVLPFSRGEVLALKPMPALDRVYAQVKFTSAAYPCFVTTDQLGVPNSSGVQADQSSESDAATAAAFHTGFIAASVPTPAPASVPDPEVDDWAGDPDSAS